MNPTDRKTDAAMAALLRTIAPNTTSRHLLYPITTDRTGQLTAEPRPLGGPRDTTPLSLLLGGLRIGLTRFPSAAAGIDGYAVARAGASSVRAADRSGRLHIARYTRGVNEPEVEHHGDPQGLRRLPWERALVALAQALPAPIGVYFRE
ncbi:hypothetical protein Lfu02_15060 [Longispora fulva]|uniref:Uncharacterized protein n=1 Tax=Longispora fulva TaxID=619741 RepID=A0A8J7GJG1_9ACTN|nr:hypothetical protein [Longispora fulva]MBG6140484.1 hypothetical protein [Longispora fulva]GIG57134.1 hypothetical protein Lfu02_15060 [Longispora fulva]